MKMENDPWHRLCLYMDGLGAFDDGESESDCPYEQGTWQAKCWLDGFRSDSEEADDDL